MFVMSLLLRDQRLGNTIACCNSVNSDAVLVDKLALHHSRPCVKSNCTKPQLYPSTIDTLLMVKMYLMEKARSF
jgi:hypothetical protein